MLTWVVKARLTGETAAMPPPDYNRHWKILASHLVVDKPYKRLRCDKLQLPGGQIIDDWYVVENDNTSSIFALTDRREVVLLRQYRHALGRWIYELPMGAIRTGADPQLTAQAELAEETGYTAAQLEPIGAYAVAPARSDGIVHIFVATQLTLGERLFTEAEEADLEVLLVPLPRLLGMLQSAEIFGMISAFSIYHAFTAKNLWPETSA